MHVTREESLAVDLRLHRPRVWARDLALIGAASALPLALFSALPPATVALAALFAALGGAAIGALVPALLHRRVRRIPLFVLVPAAFGLGGAWAGGAALLAALATGAPWVRFTELAATAGAAQLGWLWLPYAVGVARRGSSWPTVVAACAAAPLVGWLAHVHVTW